MVASFATVAMMNAVSATVQVLDGRDDPGAGGSGASLRDRALRSYRRCACCALTLAGDVVTTPVTVLSAAGDADGANAER